MIPGGLRPLRQRGLGIQRSLAASLSKPGRIYCLQFRSYRTIAACISADAWYPPFRDTVRISRFQNRVQRTGMLANYFVIHKVRGIARGVRWRSRKIDRAILRLIWEGKMRGKRTQNFR